MADVGGLGENVKNRMNGIKVHPHPKSIARAINYLINRPEVMKKIGEKGREKVKKFNWSITTKKLLKTYHKVLES